jgi:N-acetylneuraminic acid mutarotase
LVITIQFVSAFAAGTAEWQVRTSIPFHVYGHAGAALNGKIHFLGGCHTDDWQIPSDAHQLYDPATDTWIEADRLPVPLGWSMPAVCEGKIYLFGGGYYRDDQGMTSSDQAWVYDPVSDSWKSLRSLPEPRMNGFAAASGDFIYVSLGYNRQGGGDDGVVEEFRSTYRYDPALDRYEKVADAPETGCYIASGVHKNLVFVVSGSLHEYGFHGDYHWADGVLIYDPEVDRWRRLDVPRIKKRVFFLTQCSASMVHDGRLWVVGGMAENRSRTVQTEYFDLEERRFHAGPDLPYPRCCGGGGIADGVLVIGGGFVDGKGLGAPAMETLTLEVDNEL